MWQRLRRRMGAAAVLGVALMALAACSAGELKPAASLRAEGDTGIVILSLMRSGMRDFDLFVSLKGPGQWVPRPLVLRAQSRQRDWTPGGQWSTAPTEEPEGRLLALKLPAGSYRIALWTGSSDHGGFHGDGFEIHTEALDFSFTVAPGRVTYLGSVHIVLPLELNYLANLGRATYRLEVENRRERDLALARERYADASNLDAVEGAPVQFAQAGQEIRYFIQNRKAGDGDFAQLRRR